MKRNDQDIVDALLDRTAPGSGGHAAPADTTEAGTPPEQHPGPWAALLAANRASQSTAARHARIIDATLARLQAEAQGSSVAAPSRWCAGTPARHTFPRYALPALLAASLTFVASLGWLTLRPASTPSNDAQLATLTSQDASPSQYVDFAASQPGDGTPAAPFASLEEALTRTPAEATLRIHAGATGETLRLEKRLRLEALNGSVQVGAS